ncbi:DUF916 and DUF3324 domain-containing protein [Enterococcus ratti]|nr:DUF916 and DUF3324 domain-containing protein [Enterococcus ratti]
MKHFIKNIFVLTIVMISAFAFEQMVRADNNYFSVTPVLPENQKSKDSSFFDLKVVPNQKQHLQINVTNHTATAQKYKISINTATTNQNGIIDYSLEDFEKDSSMKISLKDCLSLKESQVEIAANSEKEIIFDLNTPSEPFEGVLLGGITVEPIITANDNEGIHNIFTRTIAIQLTETENKVVPEVKAGEITVTQINLRNHIQMELRNVTPTVISKVKAVIRITKKGEKQPIIEQNKERLSFAPNSKFHLITQWQEQFESGSYVYSIELADSSGHQWHFTKEFEIKEKAAKKLNATSVDEKKIMK